MKKIPFNQIIIRLVTFVSLIGLLVIGKSMQDLSKSKVLIGFGGDTMLGRGVNEIISAKGYKYPWGNLLSELKKPDLTIVNLENTFTTHLKAMPKVFNFKAPPDRVKALEAAGIDIVNIANNHILDFGMPGLKDTINTLNNANICHIGAGLNLQNARRPVIFEKNGIIIGVIGYTDNEPNWAASENNPGINYIHIGDIKKIRHDINAIRDTVDIVIVSIHWGPNMQEKPSQETIEFAHQMIDAGVDIIHGHSAHNFQGIEIYKNKLIMYDTGDLVDDYRVNPILRNDYSFFFLATVTRKEIVQLRLIPTLISNYQVNVAEGKTYKNIISRIQKLSAEFETSVSNDGLISIKKGAKNA